MPMEILTTTCLDSIDEMARRWGIADDWDVIMVGDGSGAGWNLPGTYATVLVDRHERGRKDFYGGANVGTINRAELMAYTEAMAWYSARRRQAMEFGRPVRAICKVHVVTDHLAIEIEGQSLASRRKSVRDITANRPKWAELMAYEWEGFVFHFKHIPRASAALNVWCDDQARIVFKAMKAMARPATREGRDVSIYECNADHDAPTVLHFAERREPRKKHRKRARRDRGCPAPADG